MSKKCVIITAPGFQDEEVVYPYYRLMEEGHTVEVATKDGEVVYGKYGVPARATMATTNLKSANFDCVILPGGFEAPDRVRLLPEVQVFVREMDEQKKLVAAICHGPWIMISAKVCKGRKMTAFWSIEEDIRNSGADYQHKVPVVVDDNFITSPHYNNNGDFMKSVVSYLNNK